MNLPFGSSVYNARAMTLASYRIRRYEPGDLAAAYRICLKTGDSGEDASRLYGDPELLGHLYAGPYLVLEPELAFMLNDEGMLGDESGVCGYILGALDTGRYHRAYLERWLPALQARYPDPEGGPESWTPDERIRHLLHHPRLELPEAAHDYPSHLHIDLLPRAQGRGDGRRLMDRFLDELRARGSRGVHLGVGARNSRAQRFYHAYGFTELSRQDWGVTFGMKL